MCLIRLFYLLVDAERKLGLMRVSVRFTFKVSLERKVIVNLLLSKLYVLNDHQTEAMKIITFSTCLQP